MKIRLLRNLKYNNSHTKWELEFLDENNNPLQAKWYFPVEGDINKIKKTLQEKYPEGCFIIKEPEDDKMYYIVDYDRLDFELCSDLPEVEIEDFRPWDKKTCNKVIKQEFYDEDIGMSFDSKDIETKWAVIETHTKIESINLKEVRNGS